MKSIFVVVVMAMFAPRLAHAEDPSPGPIYAGGIVVGAVGFAVAEAVMFVTDTELAREGKIPSLSRSAGELGFNHLAMSIGAALVATGLDQHVAPLTGVGAAMIFTATPGTIRGMQGLAGPGEGMTDDARRADRHAAGVTEVAFGVPELAIEGIAFAAAAADPEDHVRTVGMATAGLLAISSGALLFHGIHTLVTPEQFEHISEVVVVPTVIPGASGPTMGIGAYGRF